MVLYQLAILMSHFPNTFVRNWNVGVIVAKILLSTSKILGYLIWQNRQIKVGNSVQCIL